LSQRFVPEENEDTQLYEDITRNINTALTILFSIECLLKIFGFGLRVSVYYFNHGLRGSASPVLTATGLVNGKW